MASRGRAAGLTNQASAQGPIWSLGRALVGAGEERFACSSSQCQPGLHGPSSSVLPHCRCPQGTEAERERGLGEHEQ